MIYNEITFSRTPTSFNYHRDDYRIIAIEKWYQNEITRCHRKLEFQVEVFFSLVFYFLFFIEFFFVVSLVIITF